MKALSGPLVTSVTVGFDQKQQLVLVKYRFHDLSSACFTWPSTVAVFVGDHLKASAALDQRALDLQPTIGPQDWDGDRSQMSEGVEVHEFTDGVVTIIHFQKGGNQPFALSWGAVALLRHYLAELRPMLVDLAAPPPAGTRKH